MNKIVDVATLIFTVAAITVLVRPNSQGPRLVEAIGSATSNIVRSATSFNN